MVITMIYIMSYIDNYIIIVYIIITITYCVKCRKLTDSNNEEIIRLDNGQNSLYSICNICGQKKINSLQIITQLVL